MNEIELNYSFFNDEKPLYTILHYLYFLKAESETQKVYMCIAIRVHVRCMLWQGLSLHMHLIMVSGH